MCSLESYLRMRDRAKVNYSIKDIFIECGVDAGDGCAEALNLRKLIRIATNSREGFLPTHVSTRRGRDIIIDYLKGA